MKLSMGIRARRLAAAAVGLVGLVVMTVTATSTKATRPSVPASIHVDAASAPSVTPGLARAETDVLDLQLD